MCNDYARQIEVSRTAKLLDERGTGPVIGWAGGRIPNSAAPTDHVRIGDQGVVVRLDGDQVTADAITWAWKAGPKPVFNFRSEGRDFSGSDRCLILATGFYEYTAPAKAKVKLKDQHLFTMAGEDWFWIAGIIKHYAFTMLTTAPGPDIKPYHDRQICVLPPDDGMAWLQLTAPEKTLLRPLPIGTLRVKTLRRDGEAV